MCGRFTNHAATQKAERLYATTNSLAIGPRYNVALGTGIPIIVASHRTDDRSIGPARWGLIPA